MMAHRLGVVGLGSASCRPGTAMSISAPQLHCGGWWYLQHEWPFVSITICSKLFSMFPQSVYINRLNTDSPVLEEQAGMGEEP